MTKSEIISSIYEAFNKGDITAILEKLADDVAWESWADNTAQKAGVSYLKRQDGRSGAADFFKNVAETLQISEFSVLSIMEGADQVAAEFVIEAVYLPTGKRYRDEEMHLWTFNDRNEIVRFRHYADTAKHIAVSAPEAQSSISA